MRDDQKHAEYWISRLEFVPLPSLPLFSFIFLNVKAHSGHQEIKASHF